MSSVSEWVVREYFEALGFVVSQPCKHVVPGRQKRPEEGIDLLVVNPRVSELKIPERRVWDSADLGGVSRAIVGIIGWHTDHVYASTFAQTPELLRFAEPAAARSAEKILGPGRVAKILCVPRLPASEDLREKVLQSLGERGVDGVICFQQFLPELVARVDPNRNYEKSDLMQMIRILKSYDLLKGPQMELFSPRRKRASAATPAPSG